MRPPSVSRSLVTRALCLLPALRPPLVARSIESEQLAPSTEPEQSVLPLELCGGAYCLNYTIDKQLFRAVVDTGSPFVLVDGTCQDPRARTLWGCYRGDGRPSGLAPTDELFGGVDVGTEWRLGELALAPSFRPTAERQWIAEGGEVSVAKIDDATFGVVRSFVDKGGGAVFLGLAKRRLPRIRPTFLEQTRVAAMRFDFVQRSLTLSASPLVPRAADAVRTIDLRPRGAPVATYAARIQRLVVNGEVVELDRPAVCIIDTGTTGCSVSDELFDNERLPQVWRDARIELQTEKGALCALEASVRKRRPAARGIPPPSARGIALDAREFDEFPLIVTPVRVPWFDADFGQQECADGEPYQCNGQPIGRRRSLLETLRVQLGDGLGEAPYVLFVGLAFYWQRLLTIDIDEGRMTIE